MKNNSSNNQFGGPGTVFWVLLFATLSALLFVVALLLGYALQLPDSYFVYLIRIALATLAVIAGGELVRRWLSKDS